METNTHKTDSFKGIVIDIASFIGLSTCPSSIIDWSYQATKHTVVGYSVSKDLHFYHNTDKLIRLYTICPGFVKTDMTKIIQDKPALEGFITSAGGWTNSDRV